MDDVFIAGYSDKLSARPGDTVQFCVSSYARSDFSVSLHRSISADPNPDGPGIIEEDAGDYFAPAKFPSRIQAIKPGSYAESHEQLRIGGFSKLEVELLLMPSLLSINPQTLLSWGELSIFLDKDAFIVVEVGGERATKSSKKLYLRQWYRCELLISESGIVWLNVDDNSGVNSVVTSKGKISEQSFLDLQKNDAPVRIAAASVGLRRCFNGKIEAPQIRIDNSVVAEWDFSSDISSLIVEASAGPNLFLKNAPTRGMTGSKWDGTEFCWKHQPKHYQAIYFHEDDIYDFGWGCDFEFIIPEDMPSGIYVMRIRVEGNEDAIPFFVCPPLGKPKSDLCVLISTFTYTVYGNHARPDYNSSWLEKTKNWGAYPHSPGEFQHYGLSTYNTHKDGSGICHASNKRVLFNLRPGYVTFGSSKCSGLRHLQADSHLISWLHHNNIGFDVITDDELDQDGLASIAPYSVVMTGSHPEYHTSRMLDALSQYRDSGGGLMYLGGNGFYWRIARHHEDPSLIEIRRSEDGIRAWAAEPGEYYNAFDGTYGGLWRRNGRPPQKLVGIGFTAQANFVGMPYQRTCYKPEFEWVFGGIDDDILGDFGYSGNGAAGFELDRVDEKLGGNDQVVILAQSYDKNNEFMLVPEELLTHLTNLSGEPEDQVKRADMIYFKTASGGRVFSVGSITFCGSLPWNGYDNNISKLLWNVLEHFRHS